MTLIFDLWWRWVPSLFFSLYTVLLEVVKRWEECRIALFQIWSKVCWANVFVVTVSSYIVRLGQDFWQVFHGADATYFKQHGGETGWGSTQEVYLVRDFILRKVVGDCRYIQAGGNAQVSHGVLKHILFVMPLIFSLIGAVLTIWTAPSGFEGSAVLESQTLLTDYSVDALKISYLLTLPLNCWIIHTLPS